MSSKVSKRGMRSPIWAPRGTSTPCGWWTPPPPTRAVSRNGAVTVVRTAADLSGDKFESDFVVFVNLQTRAALKHEHRGELGFEHLSFYVLPADQANAIYRKWLRHWYAKPKRDCSVRKLGNMAVHVPAQEMTQYENAWNLLKARGQG